MIGMIARAAEPYGAAAGKVHGAIAPLTQQRMLQVYWRKLSSIFVDRADHGRAKRLNLRLDPAEQRAVGLRAATDRLIEKFAGRDVKRAQHLRQTIERRQTGAEIE